MSLRPVIPLIFLILCVNLCALAEESAMPGFEYREMDYAGGHYMVVLVDVGQVDLRLFWKNDQGEAYKRFHTVAHALKDKDEQLRFAMNSGIYAKDYTPLGLHIEDGEILEPLNLKDGGGNFFLKPNGVFFVEDAKAGILGSDEYGQANKKPQLAVQSGPILLEKGIMHPRFLKDSKSIHFRNGVGVLDDGRAAFVLSRWPVNFYRFASFFKDELKCQNALYLDGSLSGIYLPEAGLTVQGDDYVGMLGVVVKKEEKS